MKEYFDKSSHTHTLQEGDKVFLYVHVTPKHLSRKLRHPWCGGFVIHKFLGPNTAKLRKLCDGKILKAGINVKRLKKCIDPKERPNYKPMNEVFPPLDDLTDDDIPVENFETFMASRDPDIGDLNDQNNPFASHPLPTQPDTQSQAPFVTVEKVMARKKVNGRVLYKVRWLGYGAKDDQWVNEEEMNETLREFINSNPPPKKRRRNLKR